MSWRQKPVFSVLIHLYFRAFSFLYFYGSAEYLQKYTTVSKWRWKIFPKLLLKKS